MKPSLITSLGFVRVATIAPVVSIGDVQRNVENIQRAITDAHAQGAEIMVLPELCLTGYTCGDMFRDASLMAATTAGLERLRQWSENLSCLFVVGAPVVHGGHMYNAAVAICNGNVVACVPKTFLPNTGEFYDGRWFRSGRSVRSETISIAGSRVPFGTDLILADVQRQELRIGIELCEDLWSAEPPSGRLARAGATLILNLSASNELVGKSVYRRRLVQTQSARTYTCYAYASAGPGESTTDTVFGGHCLISECGEPLAEGERFVLAGTQCIADVDVARCVRERLGSTSFPQEVLPHDVVSIEVSVPRHTKSTILRPVDPRPFVPSNAADRDERCREIASIQATGLAMRLERSRSKRLVIGVSGGLDSTLALLVCRDACRMLERSTDTILAVALPGPGTTRRTHSNAELLCAELGIPYRVIDITTAVMDHFRDIGHDPSVHDVTYENAQARERTHVLMDLANMHAGMVVGTGDLSEIALGWSTYNADHMSMYNPNAGVPKTLVRSMIEWHAAELPESTAVILRDILDTPISPELLPSDASADSTQRTEDVLGPYEVHDFFLYHFVRLRQPINTIAVLAMHVFDGVHERGQILAWLEVFVRRFVNNQFKRSCMPDGPKVGSVSLSPRADWRMPSDMSADALIALVRSVDT
ncbi:MAG: NAD(+) synthase [Candidatus Kapabacteria bacterium]|nr:NAD(+) synthase [Candidatus Kapabacteria bacterium]